MSTQPFNSNETLEMCDVKVCQDGSIDIETKPYHSAELERLGKPEKAVRGRMKRVEQNLQFSPYAVGARNPTFSEQLVVGITTLSLTAENVKVSFKMPRHLTLPVMLAYIEGEFTELKRRLMLDVYDKLAKASNVDDNVNDNDNVDVNDNGHPDGKVSVNVEKKGGDV